MDSGTAALAGRALHEFGAQHVQIGQYVQQAEQARFQQQRAQDVLDSSLGNQDFLQQYQAAIAERQQGDYRNLADDVVKLGNQIADQISHQRNLSPQARAFFREKTQTAITQAQQNALGETSKRRDQETAYNQAQRIQTFQEQMGRATDPMTREMLKSQFQMENREFVATGLVHGDKMAEMERRSFEAVADQDVEIATQGNPSAMRQQLLNQIQGKPTNPSLPLARRESLARLHNEAVQVEHNQITKLEHAERMADYRLNKQQEVLENDLRARISNVLMVPENIAKYDALQAEVNGLAQGEKPKISGQFQTQALHEIRQLRAAAISPPKKDDTATEQKMVLFIDAASNDAEYEWVRQQVIGASSALKPETTNRLLSQIYQRRSESHYSQQPGYKEGVRIILGGEVSEGTLMAMLRAPMNEAEQARQRNAMDAYRDAMAQIAQESIPAVNAQGREVAMKMRTLFMDIPAKASKIGRLPQVMKTPDGKALLEDKEEVRQLIQQIPYVSDAFRQRLFDQYEDAYTSPGPTPSGAGQPAGQSQQRTGRGTPPPPVTEPYQRERSR